jgi:hypothetical protein
MKDSVITAKRKKTELITLLICFIMANLANLYAIVSYKTSFSELFTSLGYVFVASFVLYGIWTLLRIVTYGLGNVFRKRI